MQILRAHVELFYVMLRSKAEFFAGNGGLSISYEYQHFPGKWEIFHILSDFELMVEYRF